MPRRPFRPPFGPMRLPADAWEEVEPTTREDGRVLRRWRLKGTDIIGTEEPIDEMLEMSEQQVLPMKRPYTKIIEDNSVKEICEIYSKYTARRLTMIDRTVDECNAVFADGGKAREIFDRVCADLAHLERISSAVLQQCFEHTAAYGDELTVSAASAGGESGVTIQSGADRVSRGFHGVRAALATYKVVKDRNGEDDNAV